MLDVIFKKITNFNVLYWKNFFFFNPHEHKTVSDLHIQQTRKSVTLKLSNCTQLAQLLVL